MGKGSRGGGGGGGGGGGWGREREREREREKRGRTSQYVIHFHFSSMKHLGVDLVFQSFLVDIPCTCFDRRTFTACDMW